MSGPRARTEHPDGLGLLGRQAGGAAWVTDEEETPRGGQGVIFHSEHPTTLEPLSGPRRPRPSRRPPSRRRATGVGSLTCVGQTGESISLRDGKDAWGLEHTPMLHRHLSVACNSRHHSEHCRRKRPRQQGRNSARLDVAPAHQNHTHTLAGCRRDSLWRAQPHMPTLFVGSLRFWNAKMQSR